MDQPPQVNARVRLRPTRYGQPLKDTVTIGNCELIHADAFEVLENQADCSLLFLDPPFELYDPEFLADFNSRRPWSDHLIAMSKFPYTGIVQTGIDGIPLVAEYIWHFTDMCSYRARYMPLIHHETISVFSHEKKEIDLDCVRQPHRRSLAAEPQFKTNKSRGKQGKPLHWQQSEKGAWKSSVIICQRSLQGEMQDKDTVQPVGVKPLGMLMGLLPAHGKGPILDPFMGSGSVAIAAAMMGRPYVGIEINREYFELAVRRLEDHTRNGDLFA